MKGKIHAHTQIHSTYVCWYVCAVAMVWEKSKSLQCSEMEVKVLLWHVRAVKGQATIVQ